MALHEPRTIRLATTALAIVASVLAASVVQASEERFRLLPGSVMLNDDAGIEGTMGYARGLGYEVMQGYAVAEGDMVLGRIDARGRLETPFRPRGLGLRSRFDRWPDGIVPYAFHPGISAIQQKNVEEAIERLNAKTRIALLPAEDPAASDYEDYILFEPSGGCASFVGRQLTENAQALWVADSCSVGSIVHEIAHAIGLFHEHTRPDRDNNVSIVWDEIVDDKAFNFEIYADGAEAWGEYDYDSIMHYGEYFFSKRGERTIIAPPDVDIGQRVQLSADDIDTLDRMYATDLSVDATPLVSDRGLEIDLSVINAGDLGARGLTLRVSGGPGTDWLSISADSGWDCLAHDEELRCERTRLIEQASSRFTVVADPETTTVEEIAYRLDSITLDTNPDNNGEGVDSFDDELDDDRDGDDRASSVQPLAAAVPTAADDREETEEPETGAAEPERTEPDTRSATVDASGPSAATEGSGGGGGSAPLAAFVLLGAIAIRRRRPRD